MEDELYGDLAGTRPGRYTQLLHHNNLQRQCLPTRLLLSNHRSQTSQVRAGYCSTESSITTLHT